MAKPKRNARSSNPLVAGIHSWIEANSNTLIVTDDEARIAESGKTMLDRDKDIPKRYTIYEPMLLLGPTFESHTPRWQSLWLELTESSRSSVLAAIVDQFCQSGQRITHVAVNAPISATTVTQTENIMRSPLNLKPLFGDFGPDYLLGNTGLDGANSYQDEPCKEDFQSAFWVQASQLNGIVQVWAPRWTMFSRGNIREKGRILGQRNGSEARFPGLDSTELGEGLSEIDVVDFYVGIGYFAFPYLARGVRRVFGWEINGWSVEGLRRGCEANGWNCLVVRIGHDATSRKEAVAEVVEAIQESPNLKCVIFWGNNVHASKVMADLATNIGDSKQLNVRHCNLGLLPSSTDMWLDSARVLSPINGGWLHVHENVEISKVANRESEVVNRIQSIVATRTEHRWTVQCDHIEMVKTYAPGVGHFVFDIHIWPAIK